MRNLVIIPTYNELDNIRPMIDKVFSLPEKFDLLVIDDGSPDGTAEIVRERQKAYPESLHLIERQGKLGLGTAYLTGFRWALEHGYDYVFEMDCDFSHNPDDLIRLSAAAAEGADLVIGSRYVTGVNDEAGSDVVLRVGLRPRGNGHAGPRRDGRIRLLQREAAPHDGYGRRRDEGLRLSGRDEIHGMEARLPDQGSADYLHRADAGRVENERRHLPRGVLRRTEAAFPHDQTARMMSGLLIRGGTIVNEGESYRGWIVVKDERIARTGRGDYPRPEFDGETIDAEGMYVLPGVIDDQVHFREPGLTYKGDLHSESIAAAAGGVTSYMDMPNVKPPTVTNALLEEKLERAAETSVVNYSFYLGATNDNIEQIRRLDPKRVCGVKLFMGSSTGNMLVDDERALRALFAESPVPIAAHCEDEPTVRADMERFRTLYGESGLTAAMHPLIRSAEACLRSSEKAVSLAERYGGRLHVLHLSTARELSLFDRDKPLEQKRITCEVCVHHLWFSDADYARKGNLIKWNPAVKTAVDRDALRAGLLDGAVDVVATDHAPHTLEEKERPYASAPSGGPLVQHSLPMMLELSAQGVLPVETVVEKMCHAPARLFGVRDRGFLRTGHFADIVLVRPADPWTVSKENILYKCGWSPLEGTAFSHRIMRTLVNGRTVYADGRVDTTHRGAELEFDR